MDYQHIVVEKEEGVAIIRMNRPEVLNASISLSLLSSTDCNEDDPVNSLSYLRGEISYSSKLHNSL